MAMQVDYVSVFATEVPKIYIKSVEIVPSTISTALHGEPYDMEADDELQENQFGRKRPGRNSPRNINNRDASRSLKIKVELTVKERVKRSGRTTWFNKLKSSDYLKARIILARDQDTIEALTDGDFTIPNLKKLKQRNKVLEKIISLKKYNTEVGDLKKETLDNRPIYCATYEAVFDIGQYRPNNLAVFAGVFSDYQARLVEAAATGRPSRQIFQGTVASQKIISNGEQLNTSNVYILDNGKVWGGPVHYHEDGGFMAGAFHSDTTEQPLLERRQVPNLVVKDYRLLEHAEKAELLLKPYRIKRRKKPENKTARENRIQRKDVYIAEPKYSFDRENDVRFAFHLDFHKLLAEKTKFGSCFVAGDQRARQFIIDNTKIKSLKVYRYRVEPGLGKEMKLVDYDDRTELITDSTDGNNNRLRPRRNSVPKNPAELESERVVIGGIRELALNENIFRGIRTFAVSDFGMSSITDGTYCYGVEFEITDGTKEFVNEQKTKLSQAINSLREYYKVASRKENVDVHTGEFTENFLDLVRETYLIPGQEAVLTGTRRERRLLVQSSISNAPWLNSIAVYADLMKNMTNIRENVLIDVVRLLHNILEPVSGNLQSIELFITLLESLQSKISDVFSGDKEQMVDEMDFSDRTRAYKGKMPPASIVLKRKFKTFHDSNIQNNVGYDFLGVRKRLNSGPTVVTTQQLEARLELENKKYFTQNPDNTDNRSPSLVREDGRSTANSSNFSVYIDLNDSYHSYLTPAVVYNGDKRLKLTKVGRKLWNPKRYNNIFSNLLTILKPKDDLSFDGEVRKKPRTSEHSDMIAPISYDKAETTSAASISSLSVTDVGTNISNSIVMSSLGISMVSPQAHSLSVSLERLNLGLEEDEALGVDPKEVLGESTKFATEKISELADEVEEAPDISETVDIAPISNIFVNSSLNKRNNNAEQLKESISMFNPENESNIIDRKHFSSKNLERLKVEDEEQYKIDFLKKIPNQIKSIFLSGGNRTNKDWFFALEEEGKDLLKDPTYAGLFYVNYSHINAIEVLVGFENGRDGRPQLQSPIYQRLDRDLFNRILESGDPFICRLVTASNSLGPRFNKSSTFRLPEYHTSFVLISNSALKRRELEATTDAEEPEPEFETTETNDDDIFVSRLAEYNDLNTTGRQVLSRLVSRSVKMNNMTPEFSTNNLVQQPRTVARVGTGFNAPQEETSGQDSRAIASNLARAATRRTRTMSPLSSGGAAASVSSPASSATPRAASAVRSNSSGGTSGGSY